MRRLLCKEPSARSGIKYDWWLPHHYETNYVKQGMTAYGIEQMKYFADKTRKISPGTEKCADKLSLVPATCLQVLIKSQGNLLKLLCLSPKLVLKSHLGNTFYTQM